MRTRRAPAPRPAVSRRPPGPRAARYPTSASLPRQTHLEHDVLEGVGGGDGAAQGCTVGPVHQGGDGRGVAGVVDLCLRQALDRPRRRAGGGHRLDVGGVAGLRAAHEGVLTDLAFGQELLGGRPAHRAGHGGNDHIAHSQPVEDPLVGLAVRVVGDGQPGVVDVEGVGVLHHEFTAAQDAGPRPRLVAVLGLDLVEQHREILVGAVLPLTVRVNSSSWVGPSR